MKKWMLSLSAIAAFTSSVFAGGNIKFSEYDLPNGLHVILHEDHTTPSVVVSVLYHVGSKNEDPQRTGFAHFFEHLMFEGSDNIKRGEYMKLVESNGGVLNANTSWDRTYYFQQMPSNQLELALWMEAERMAHLNVDSTGIETQRKVVKEEKKMRYENTPYGHLIEQVCAGSFKVHPYRWTPIGEAQYIDQAKYGEFMDFYKLFYVPNNATLTIAGDFTPAQAKAYVEKYYGYIPKGTQAIPRPSEKEPKWTAEERKTYYDKVQLPGVIFSYHTPEQGTTDAYALEMLGNVLSNGKSSRLQKVIVDEKQMAVQAGAFPMPMEDPGITMMYGIANQGVSEVDLEAAMDEVVNEVVKNGITDEELQKVKNQIENGFVNQNARLMGVAENLANYHVYFQNTDLINTELDRYMKVTKADIARVAKQYLKKENRLVLYYLPKKEN
jgi:predicted Zn-dependent peptidase